MYDMVGEAVWGVRVWGDYDVEVVYFSSVFRRYYIGGQVWSRILRVIWGVNVLYSYCTYRGDMVINSCKCMG